MKIKYKSIPENLRRMTAPTEPGKSQSRSSLGLESIVGEFNYICVEDLIPHVHQARKIFDIEELEAMAKTIKQYGIKQPLTIIPSPTFNGKYEVISGERRLRSAKIAGLERVPCIITQDPTQTDAIALIENIHRKDLHPIELGITYKKLLEKKIFNSARELANQILVSESVISEYLQYADLPEDIQNKVLNDKISNREQLRNILKTQSFDLIGHDPYIDNTPSFSVMRVKFTDNNLHFQTKGLNKLGDEHKLLFKQKLEELISKL